MIPADKAVRARRTLTNKFIKDHQAERLRPFFAPDAKVIVGDGALVVGADAILSAFAAQFAEPGFIAYVRSAETVHVDEAELRASETGTWTGTWRNAAGVTEMSGDYLAVWRKQIGQWVIESEVYVTLKG